MKRNHPVKSVFRLYNPKLVPISALAIVLFCAGVITLVLLAFSRGHSGSESAGQPPALDATRVAAQPTHDELGIATTSRPELLGGVGTAGKSSHLDSVPATISRTPQTVAARSRIPEPGEKSSHDARSASRDAVKSVSRVSTSSTAQEFLPPSLAEAGAPAKDGASSGAPEMVIEVPAGQKVPAVFYETEPKPAPQQKMLDRIATEFNETVANPPPGVSEQEIWEDARRRADEQYLKLYGHAAYNARHLQAAREAVREKRALEAAQQQIEATASSPVSR